MGDKYSQSVSSSIYFFSDFECQKWVSLGELLNEPFQASDGLNYMIDDADLCLDPCNINGGKTSWYDAQDACEVKIQNMENSEFINIW